MTAVKRYNRLLVVVGLALAVTLAAVFLVSVRYEARELQAQLAQMQQEEQKLQDQNRRYQLHLATLTDYQHLHALASDEQGLEFPDPGKGTYLDLEQLWRESAGTYAHAGEGK